MFRRLSSPWRNGNGPQSLPGSLQPTPAATRVGSMDGSEQPEGSGANRMSNLSVSSTWDPTVFGERSSAQSISQVKSPNWGTSASSLTAGGFSSARSSIVSGVSSCAPRGSTDRISALSQSSHGRKISDLQMLLQREDKQGAKRKKGKGVKQVSQDSFQEVLMQHLDDLVNHLVVVLTDEHESRLSQEKKRFPFQGEEKQEKEKLKKARRKARNQQDKDKELEEGVRQQKDPQHERKLAHADSKFSSRSTLVAGSVCNSTRSTMRSSGHSERSAFLGHDNRHSGVSCQSSVSVWESLDPGVTGAGGVPMPDDEFTDVLPPGEPCEMEVDAAAQIEMEKRVTLFDPSGLPLASSSAHDPSRTSQVVEGNEEDEPSRTSRHSNGAKMVSIKPDNSDSDSQSDDDDPTEFVMWNVWTKAFNKGLGKAATKKLPCAGDMTRHRSISTDYSESDSSDEENNGDSSLHLSGSFVRKSAISASNHDRMSTPSISDSFAPNAARSSKHVNRGSMLELSGCQLCLTRIWMHLIMSPSNNLHSFWDPMSALLVAWECFVIPLQFFNLEESVSLMIMAWVVRVFWTLDLYVSSVTSFRRPNGKLERRPWPVLRHYLGTWFPFDIMLVSVDWTEVFLQGLSTQTSVHTVRAVFKSLRCIRVMRVVRFLYTLRTRKIPEFAKDFEYVFRSEFVVVFLGLFKAIAFVVYCNHLMACIWFAVSDINTGASQSWFAKAGLNEDPGDLWLIYTSSYQWSLAQFAGSVDVHTDSIVENLFGITSVLIAFVVSACVVSSITSSMTRLQMASAHQSEALNILKQYLYDNAISRKVALRVQRQAQSVLSERKRNRPEGTVELLALISEPLMMEIHFEIRMPMLLFHPFFRNHSELQPNLVKQICHSCVERLQYVKGDIVFSPGEVPPVPHMYFSENGHLSYIQDVELDGGDGIKSRTSTAMHPGNWFAEAVIWTPWIHVGLMRARGDAVVLAIDAASFQATVSRDMKTGFSAYNYGRAFVEQLNRLEYDDISDLNTPSIHVEDLVDKCCPLPESAHAKRTSFSSKAGAAAALKRSGTLLSMVGAK